VGEIIDKFLQMFNIAFCKIFTSAKDGESRAKAHTKIHIAVVYIPKDFLVQIRIELYCIHYYNYVCQDVL
jgi:hypothetical protein